MKDLFTHEEFVGMMQKYGLRHTKRKLVRGENILTHAVHLDSVILLMDGYISSYTCEAPEKLLSIFEPGIFLSYSILEETPMIVTNIALSDTCEIYEYKKEDIEYALTLFPENFGFQYFFLKKIGRHLYYRTLLNGKKHKEKLYYAMKYLGELIGSKDEQNNIVLPKEITINILIEYSTLSRAAFYRQRIHLLEKKILKTNKNSFIVQDITPEMF
ncbi:Crp/Fnr family transcriptional regulator [Listeria sp. FSL L7-1485]|uniref:Crp/Fnr family transcriptional regulator n=1 Tax=Listeria immobilis TaxID=2713502 RepID=A0A7X1CA02_9LIST|nr:Crp/Fnr family transcriptional regulator [Listeria immobilis]MBC1483930.1 Crp/Fnr family transcriptional regulator [Listeria immobilis]MBC1489901.1 Crp/Fnr family transcriptional regulator [Listeria immobilis]MBC1505414.1 Crp/Fnr family transcriptional regulator [Listeria immobilis]MBC1509153.1 Crp/Fnr family transcriptional regulator [Listeria immobilis]MBC1514562.1 Crp/Fnr family transcriptional regulator [Listeria immobilis]